MPLSRATDARFKPLPKTKITALKRDCVRGRAQVSKVQMASFSNKAKIHGGTFQCAKINSEP